MDSVQVARPNRLHPLTLITTSHVAATMHKRASLCATNTGCRPQPSRCLVQAYAQQQDQQQSQKPLPMTRGLQLGKAVTRREIVLQATGLPLVLAGMLVGTDDPTTIVNSVLSGYGLPMFKQSFNDFRSYDEFENDWYFEYPRNWVARANTLRNGFYVSNFQTADKATVESFTFAPGGSPEEQEAELIKRAVAAAIVPGADQRSADRLLLPAERLIKSESKSIDGQIPDWRGIARLAHMQKYIYLRFPSETITSSGYAIKRKHFAVVAARKGVAYTASASARSDQYNKEKEQILQRIVDSFRLR